MNRRSTKVHLWVKVADLPLTEIEKKRIRTKLAHHINHKDEIWIEEQEERSQEMNKEKALERLNEMIEEALYVPPKRIPTEPPRNVEENRIQNKKLHSEKKRGRLKTIKH